LTLNQKEVEQKARRKINKLLHWSIKV